MIEFEYKGKIYYTENLDKKLKRLKIKSRDEIKIITENSSHGQKKQENPADNDYQIYPHIFIYDDFDNTIHNMLWDTSLIPSIDSILQTYNFYNENTKTGMYTPDYVKSHWHILKHEPKFPLNIINGLPELSDNSIQNNSITIL